MSGIVFFGTGKLVELKDFYTDRIGCRLWLEQEDCIILKNGNLLLGFCKRDKIDTAGIITFFYDTKEKVDRTYQSLKSMATSSPTINEKYRIYQFYTRDPEGRTLEFQCFDHPVDRYFTGSELLLNRRSIRDYKPMLVPEDILRQVLDISRFAPTARNSQSYYFKIITDKEILVRLAGVRGKSTVPIARAPMAVAVCADPDLSKRYIQDGCIAAYHFILTACHFGLGTCWIAAMDKENVKEMLGIPQHHYLVTVTPLGYPESLPVNAPARKNIDWFIRS